MRRRPGRAADPPRAGWEPRRAGKSARRAYVSSSSDQNRRERPAERFPECRTRVGSLAIPGSAPPHLFNLSARRCASSTPARSSTPSTLPQNGCASLRRSPVRGLQVGTIVDRIVIASTASTSPASASRKAADGFDQVLQNRRRFARSPLTGQNAQIIVEPIHRFGGPAHRRAAHSVRMQSLRCRWRRPSNSAGRHRRGARCSSSSTLPAFARPRRSIPVMRDMNSMSACVAACSRGAGSSGPDEGLRLVLALHADGCRHRRARWD